MPEFISVKNMKVDHAGKRYGKLVAIGPVSIKEFGNYKAVMWLCQCDCGETTEAQSGHLVQGLRKSCGCLHKQSGARTHGGSDTPEYKVWKGMRERCSSPGHVGYARYGGRGITVCERWENSFWHFIVDMGPRPHPSSNLDRIDNNGPYSPDNCRWSTPKENARNSSRVRRITAFGRSRLCLEWADDLGVDSGLIRSRLARGWTPEEAVSTPKLKKRDIYL